MQAIEFYACRWPTEPSNALGKQDSGAGSARNRTARAVERTVPFVFLVQVLMIVWYARACDPALALARRRKLRPWYLSRTAPSGPDMRDALRGMLASTWFNRISPGRNEDPKSTRNPLASDIKAA